MNGYSPKLPLTLDAVDGPYTSNKTSLESVQQNLKMLILTNPGERIMNPDFGVGIRKLLFEQDTQLLQQTIIDKINIQISKYMNFIDLLDIQITGSGQDNNTIYIQIKYSIPILNETEELNLTIDSI